MRRYRRAIFHALFCLCVPAAIPASAAGAQETGDLTGRALTPATDVHSGVESVVGSLLAGTIKGDISHVLVTRDEPTRLALRVTYSGFAGAKLWVETSGSDKKPQRAVRGSPPAVLSESAGEVELTLELDPNAPENTTVKSAYLRVCVAKADRTTPSFVKTFQLRKSWQKGLRPENVVLTVVPKPVGTTATLGPTPSYQLPPKVVRPEIVRAPGLTTAMRPATTTAPRTISPGTRTISGIRSTTSPGSGSATGTGSASAGPTTTPRIVGTRVMVPNRAVVARTDSAAKLLPKYIGMAAIGSYKFGVAQDDKLKGAKGPGANPVEPLAQLRSEDIDLDPSHVLGVFPGFYPDQNASSGIYYFLPYSYSLRWDPDEGYDLRMIYSAATTEGQSGEVAMAARLDAGIGLRERRVATDLISAYAKVNALPFTSLRAMPIESLAISISDDLRRYNIPPEKIAITGLTDFLGQIGISWTTDPVTKENLEQALVEDVGVSGRVTLFPSGGALGPIDVPIQVRLADFTTFGPFRWSRLEPWRNSTPYPIRLKYLNALVLDPSSRPVVYSWDLAGTLVPPEARVTWQAGSVPGWIDSRAERLWLEYSVDDECAPCDERVIRSITGGVSSSGPSYITFHTITPLADAGAYEIEAQVRSRYFDPQSRDVQTKTVVLNADGKDFSVGPVYLGTRQPGESFAGDPLFEYFLELTMADGTTHRATRWLPSDDLRFAIGRRQLEEALGSLPGAR